MKRFAALMLCLALTAACSRAATPTSAPAGPVLHVENLVVTAAADPHAGSTAYMLIRNAGAAPDRLLSASSPLAQRIAIFDTRRGANGAAEDYPISGGVPIPEEGEISLAPGAAHLVLYGLAAPLAEGDRAPITLVFERTGAIQFEAIVTSAAAPAP